jgi:hypothetical protein
MSFIIRKLLPFLGAAMLGIYGWFFLLKDVALKELIEGLSQETGLRKSLGSMERLRAIPSPAYLEKQLYFEILLELEQMKILTGLKKAEKFQRLFPGYYNMEARIAWGYLKRTHFRDAHLWIEKAIDYHPYDEENYVLLSQILRRLKQTEAAKTALETARKLKLRNKNFRESL